MNKKKVLAGIAFAMLTASVPSTAQNVVSSCYSPYYTREYQNCKLQKQARKWLKQGNWRQGFTLADPDESVNITEFYLQYQKNPEQWKALFGWIAQHDLLTLPAGKHAIPGSSLAVSVEDSENGPLESRQSESHYHHIDFQYAVKGTERFGIIDHVTSVANTKYKPDVIHYQYDEKRAIFRDSRPDKFFIFFPCDWHIAKVNSPKVKDQNIRVIVIKVDYKD